MPKEILVELPDRLAPVARFLPERARRDGGLVCRAIAPAVVLCEAVLAFRNARDGKPLKTTILIIFEHEPFHQRIISSVAKQRSGIMYTRFGHPVAGNNSAIIANREISAGSTTERRSRCLPRSRRH